MKVSRWLLLTTSMAAAAACGDSEETATGKGGFDFGAGGSGECVAGDACTVRDKLGACAEGTLVCEEDARICSGPDPLDETCEGTDESCDGVIDEGCGVTLEAFASDGTPSTPVTSSSFPVNGSATLFAEAALGASLPDGWLRVTSLSPKPVGGLVAQLPLAESAAAILTPTLSPAEAGTTVVLPYYRVGDPGTGVSYGHTITLVNTVGATASLSFQRFGSSGGGAPVTLPLGPYGSLRTSVVEVFGASGVYEEGFVTITADREIALAYQETKSDAVDAAADAGFAAAASSLVLPYFTAGSSSDTDVRLSTQQASPVSVVLRAHLEDGTQRETTVEVPAQSVLAVSLQPIFSFAPQASGWLEIVAAAPVAASAMLGDGASGGIALYGPADALDTVHWIAGPIADAATGLTTDVALANPSADAAAVTLQAFSADGAPVAQTSVVLGPGGARVASLASLFGVPTLDGWVRVVSDEPITGAYLRRSQAPGVGVTRLHHRLTEVAIVPELRALASGLHTGVTLILPERRAFDVP
jgi:hypothetical protein